MTREEGKNEKFRAALMKHFENDDRRIRPTELPCIAHADGPDYEKLTVTLQETKWDYVTITSPEAARVLASAWPWKSDSSTTTNTQRPLLSSGSAAPAVAAVGKATEQALREAEIDVRFCPSKATAKVLVQELPQSTGKKVLYPASAQAKTTLQNGLEERGFCVTRLDTYDTVTAVWDDDEKEIARQTRVACFASPSAVKGWLQNTDDNKTVLAACIGETSAKECREQGWKEESIFYPDKPGIEGWVQAVADAVETLES